MLNYILIPLLVACLTWLASRFASLQRNLRCYTGCGLPILTTPIDVFNNNLWMALGAKLAPYLNRLPFGWGNFTRYAVFDWQRTNKFRFHAEHGPGVFVVGPHTSALWIGDADAAASVIARTGDFVKSLSEYLPLHPFGPNVLTTEASDWQRHRRILDPTFNEHTYGNVWREAVRQATAMLASWTALDANDFNTVESDASKVALHVISATVIAVSHDWNQPAEPRPADRPSMDIHIATATWLNNSLTTFAIPIWAWQLPFVSKLWSLAVARKTLFDFISTQLQDQQVRTESTAARASGTILHDAVSVNESPPPSKPDDAWAATAPASSSPNTLNLTHQEMLSNIFTFLFAGHQTVTSALCTTFLYLSAHPTYQPWLRTELAHITSLHGPVATWDPATVTPPLKRTHALMLETLRLVPPSTTIGKINPLPQTLDIAGRPATIPAGTTIRINTASLQTDPRYWGADSLAWKPDRWLVSPRRDDASAGVADVLAAETLVDPRPGTYMPFNDGPHICIGKMLAETEFHAVIACVFEKYTLSALCDGVGQEAATARILQAIETLVTPLTPHLKEPREMRLRAVRAE